MLQLQVTNSPFNENQVELLNRLLPTLTETQQIWLSGYLSAIGRTTAAAPAGAELQVPSNKIGNTEVGAAVTSQPAASREVTILFGSQTGNCQRLGGACPASWKSKVFRLHSPR